MFKGYMKSDLSFAIVGGGIVGHVIGKALHLDGHNVIMFDGQQVAGTSRACTGLIDIDKAGDAVMLLLHRLYPTFSTRLVKVNNNLRMRGYVDKDEIFKTFPSDRRIRRDANPVTLMHPILDLGDCQKAFDVVIYCLGIFTNTILGKFNVNVPGKLCPVYTGRSSYNLESDEVILQEKYREFKIRDNAGHMRISSISLNGTVQEFPKVYELDQLLVQDDPTFLNPSNNVWVCSGTGTEGIYYAAKWYLQLLDAHSSQAKSRILVDI